MTVDFISLAVIAVVAALCPIIAQLVPNKLVPESVFLLAAGAVLGPNLLGVIQLTEATDFLSELGLAFLFLLAGMEINPKSLIGHEGKVSVLTWTASFAIALVVVFVSQLFGDNRIEGFAVAIAVTTTALGTLVPILKERGLNGTPVGSAIMAFGTWGELAPILAISILLSTRAKMETLLILAAFALIAVLLAVIPTKAKKGGRALYRFVTEKANTTYQTMVRFTVLILILLVAISAIFDLDIVLGAFAAGFVMRYIIPEGDEALEHKLDGIAYGFLIPIFFICSGAKVNLSAVGESPALLALFIVALLFFRGVPIFVAQFLDKRNTLSTHNRATVAVYCTTALPLIVAVTSIAVNVGAMSSDSASIMVAAGAITVFLMPLIASLTYHVADARPAEAIEEFREHPSDLPDIIQRHLQLERLIALEMAADHLLHEDELKARIRGIKSEEAHRRHAELVDRLAKIAIAESQRQRAELSRHDQDEKKEG